MTEVDSYDSLMEQYTKLQEEYNILNEKYDILKKETSENTIVQSMNDMKEQYDHVIQNTIPLYSFKKLEERYDDMSKTCKAVVVLMEHNRKQIAHLNRYNYDDKIIRKAEIEMIVIKDLIQDIITNK